MSVAALSVGFIPLVDAAPYIVAVEMGFAQEEGLAIDLVRAPSWSSMRDMLAFGRVDAAHMLAPVPVAMSLGIGGVASAISSLMVTSVNGNVIGVSAALAERLRAAGHDFAFTDAAAAGAALVALDAAPLRLGVPFPFSMHAELLYYWLSASGLPAPQSVEIKSIPPALMADALAAGEIDAFCVGEPWGSRCVERGVAGLLLSGSAIWSFAPEKVLAVRGEWAEAEPELTGRLMRAIWKACRWLGQPAARTMAAEILGRPKYLDLPPEMIDGALTGSLTVLPTGERRDAAQFLEFHEGAANFPWRSQAAWIGAQMAARLGLEKTTAMQKARGVFRSDLYRQHLTEAGALMPSASEKTEGGIIAGTAAASVYGRLLFAENCFFDGRVFDPLAAT